MQWKINPRFVVERKGSGASEGALRTLESRFEDVPADYVELAQWATDIVLLWDGEVYLYIWGPETVLERDETYEISALMPGAFPFGDDGGGRVFVHMNGSRGPGVYSCGFGVLLVDEGILVATSLSEMLTAGAGIDVVAAGIP